jgi:CheY-like chemotaxis protein
MTIEDRRSGASMTSHPVRVLVVDDSEAIRQLIAVNLELEGYDVRRAVDGQEALEVAARWRPDVVTLDMVMPRLDGLATCARLRADPATADVAVIMAPGRAQAADRERGERVGVDAYLTKPFEPAELVATVARLAATGHRTQA